MPAQLAVEAFLDLVERSGIVPKDRVQELLDEFNRQPEAFETSQKTAEELVAREILTRWQASKLLQGKSKGFLLGPYRILRPLGKGGMGTVFLAEHQMMRRRCAVKVLPSTKGKEESSHLERFYREAQAVAALDHPNIVRAYDVNKAVQDKSEIHYLVMEYVEGKDLQTQVDGGGVLEYRQAADLTRQAAEGLAHAHESGLVHRDVKPANLLLDVNGIVKVLDLGLARFFDESEDASLTNEYGDTVLGTADYLAPEQALNCHDVDARADVYSLGQTLYFLLTGHPPFPVGSVAQRLLAHQMKAPEPIENQRPDAPHGLLAIIDTMTAKQPDDRYQTAREVADAVQEWLNEGASGSGPVSRSARFTRGVQQPPARREPTRAASAPTEDTELDLAPLDDDEPPPGSGSFVKSKSGSPSGVSGSGAAGSGAARSGAAGSGAAGRSASGSGASPSGAGSAQGAGSSVAGPGKSASKPADDAHEFPIAGAMPDLGSLESASVADMLGGAAPAEPAGTLSPLAAPVAASSPTRTAKAGKKSKTGKKDEESTFSMLMSSPVFWVGVAAAIIVVVVLAFLMSQLASVNDWEPSLVVPSQPSDSPLAEPSQSPDRSEPEPETPEETQPRRPDSSDASTGPGDSSSVDPGNSEMTGMGPDEDPADTPADMTADAGTPDAGAPDAGAPDAADPTARRAGEEDPPQDPEPKGPEPTDPQALFAGLTRLGFRLDSFDRDGNSKLNKMVESLALEAAKKARLTPSEKAPATMFLKLELDKSGTLVAVFLSAELKCPDPAAKRGGAADQGKKAKKAADAKNDGLITVWEPQRTRVASLAPRLLQRSATSSAALTTLRKGVDDFFDQFVKDHAKARAAHPNP